MYTITSRHKKKKSKNKEKSKQKTSKRELVVFENSLQFTVRENHKTTEQHSHWLKSFAFTVKA